MAHLHDEASLLTLPAELVQQILSYLVPFDLASVALTCKPLQTQSYDDQIWLPIINSNLPMPISEPTPLKSFRDLYVAHHPNWFIPRHRIWFADSEPNGKLLLARYNVQRGSIEAFAITAVRGAHELEFWENEPGVIIHSFSPQVSLHKTQPVLELNVDSTRTDDQSMSNPSDRAYAPPSMYSKEILMETFSEAGLYGSFMLCRALPSAAISHTTKVWPPLRFPAGARVRNDTQDGYKSAGHRPSRLSEVSTQNFRLRKWVEYSGRRAMTDATRHRMHNTVSSALGLAGQYFAGGMSIRMPEDITTYATLPEWCYTPNAQKPWQGIWCGDYSGHGCELLVITQPDGQDERPLPSGMEWLRNWFRGGRRGSVSSDGSYVSAQEETDYAEAVTEQASSSDGYSDVDTTDYTEVLEGFGEGASTRTVQDATEHNHDPAGRLEAIKLTGDPNIPRGEYTFIAPDIGQEGLIRVADEEAFRGARIVRSAGHIAGRGFAQGPLHFAPTY